MAGPPPSVEASALSASFLGGPCAPRVSDTNSFYFCHFSKSFRFYFLKERLCLLLRLRRVVPLSGAAPCGSVWKVLVCRLLVGWLALLVWFCLVVYGKFGGKLGQVYGEE